MLDYIHILKTEREKALGCTEPGAVAYAAACTASNMEGEPEQLDVYVSANILKNALNVGIPGTELSGIQIAAALGCLSGNPENKLESLNGITDKDIERARKFLREKRVKIYLQRKVDKLYIRTVCKNKNGNAETEIKNSHANITMIKKNGKCLYQKADCESEEKNNLNAETEKKEMNIADIYRFVQQISGEQLDFLQETIGLNKRLAESGITGKYGLGIGKELLKSLGNVTEKNVEKYVIAMTVAAIDARMGGCPLPVIALNGSGNQGLTSSLPVIFYGEVTGKTNEEIKRGILLSQLITIYIKQETGKLSALCGSALAAGTGTACAITYFRGGGEKEIEAAIKNMIADLAGVICDGAKAGCALKIATSISSACRSAYLAMKHISATETDGIIEKSGDKTIVNLGKLSTEGMKSTDYVLLRIMNGEEEAS